MGITGWGIEVEALMKVQGRSVVGAGRRLDRKLTWWRNNSIYELEGGN